MVEKFKIFEDGSIELSLTACLEDGYFPIDIIKLSHFAKLGRFPKDQLYIPSTIVSNESWREATFEELDNLEAFYKSGGKLLSINSIGEDNSIDNNYHCTKGSVIGVLLGTTEHKRDLKSLEKTIQIYYRK